MEAYKRPALYEVAPEERCLDELVERFGHRARFFAYRVERRFGLDPQWRDDLISSGYWGLLKALRNRRADAHDQELSAYVSRRVEGAVIDEARRILSRISNQVDGESVDLDSGSCSSSKEFDWEQGATGDDPELAADRAGRWRAIEGAIEHLSADHRDLLFAYVEGRSISEIARANGKSVGRLQAQMTRICREIRARCPELRRLLRHEI
jgi:RNA polymerase sigma factor (sigma-70 family)